MPWNDEKVAADNLKLYGVYFIVGGGFDGQFSSFSNKNVYVHTFSDNLYVLKTLHVIDKPSIHSDTIDYSDNIYM